MWALATLQHHYTDNMVECETLNDDYMRLYMSGSVLQQHIHMNQCGEAYFEKVRMSGRRDGPSFSWLGRHLSRKQDMWGNKKHEDIMFSLLQKHENEDTWPWQLCVPHWIVFATAHGDNDCEEIGQSVCLNSHVPHPCPLACMFLISRYNP